VVSGAIVSGSFLGFCPVLPGVLCPFDIDFLKGVLIKLRTDNRLDALDQVAVHYFSSQAAFERWSAAGPDLLGRINRLRQDMREAGLSEAQLKPILADEGSFTSLVSGSTADPNNPFNVAQRDYLVKALSRAAFADLVAYFWFWTRDVLQTPNPNVLGGDNSYGLLTFDGQQKPSYRAMQYFHSLVNRQERFLKRLTLPNPKLEGYVFIANDGRRLQIIWNEADTQVIPYAAPYGPSTTATDPVGTPIALANQIVQVGASPVFILSSTACTSRTRTNTMSTARIGPNQLRVTIVATTSAGFPNNRLTRLRFETSNNLLIDVPGGPTGSPGNFEINLPSVPAATFDIHRANSAVGGSVSFTVTDECGAWPLFVGGGPNAF
jgi:hypothetical protein